MKKIYNNGFIMFIIGGIICSTISIYAANIGAHEIQYTPTDSNWKVDNAELALNDLYKIKQENDELKALISQGNATAADIASGKTAIVNGEVITGTRSGNLTIKSRASTFDGGSTSYKDLFLYIDITKPDGTKTTLSAPQKTGNWYSDLYSASNLSIDINTFEHTNTFTEK